MKTIKHIILTLAAFLAANDLSFAQTFVNIPNDTITIQGMMGNYETLNIQQLNTSSDTITLKWEKVSESVPPAWDASVCDNKICYTTLVDSGMMNPIIPGDAGGFLRMSIIPQINYGTATIRYAVWDIDNPALKDTLTYILTVLVSGLNEVENKNAFSLFPNPATNQISILSSLETGFTYSIIDIAGKEVYAGMADTNLTSLSIESMSNGIYFFLIKSNNGFFTQKFIKK